MKPIRRLAVLSLLLLLWGGLLICPASAEGSAEADALRLPRVFRDDRWEALREAFRQGDSATRRLWRDFAGCYATVSLRELCADASPEAVGLAWRLLASEDVTAEPGAGQWAADMRDALSQGVLTGDRSRIDDLLVSIPAPLNDLYFHTALHPTGTDLTLMRVCLGGGELDGRPCGGICWTPEEIPDLDCGLDGGWLWIPLDDGGAALLSYAGAAEVMMNESGLSVRSYGQLVIPKRV